MRETETLPPGRARARVADEWVSEVTVDSLDDDTPYTEIVRVVGERLLESDAPALLWHAARQLSLVAGGDRRVAERVVERCLPLARLEDGRSPASAAAPFLTVLPAERAASLLERIAPQPRRRGLGRGRPCLPGGRVPDALAGLAPARDAVGERLRSRPRARRDERARDGRPGRLMRYGWKASAEQFGPRELVDVDASRPSGSASTSPRISDHFQPWRHTSGHAPNALVWLGAAGQATERIELGTSVLTPTLRYHPSIIAQAFGTLGDLFPGRVFLGVGTGESLNETPATGAEWPCGKERRLRLEEAIELIRRLWTEERVDFAGDYYRTQHATIYDRPETAGADLRGGVRPARREARRPRRRGLHLHQRQGRRPLPAAHSRPSRRAPTARRPRPRRRAAHDRDQGLVRHRRTRRRCAAATGGRRWR